MCASFQVPCCLAAVGVVYLPGLLQSYTQSRPNRSFSDQSGGLMVECPCVYVCVFKATRARDGKPSTEFMWESPSASYCLKSEV